MTETTQNLRLLRPLWTGLPVLLLALALSLGAAWQYLRYATPLYESVVKIRLADANEGPVNTTLLKSLDAFSGDNRAAAEAELVQSPLLLGRALDHLDFDLSTYRVGSLRTTELYRNSPLRVALTLRDPRWAGQALEVFVDAAGRLQVSVPDGAVVAGRLGQPLRLAGATLLLQANDSVLRAHPGLPLADHYRLVRQDRAQTLAAVAQGLDVTSEHGVPVLRLSYRSPVPEKAADLVNTLAQVYLDDYLTSKYRVVNAAALSIGDQIKTVRRTLARSEDTVARYRNQQRLVNVGQQTETDLRRVAELQVSRANLDVSLAAATDLDRYLREGRRNALDLAPSLPGANDVLSGELVKKIKDLQAERHDLLLRFTPQAEQVLNVDRKLADLNAYLLESARTTRESLLVKRRELDRAIGQAQGGLLGLPTREKELGIRQRDFQLNEKLYTFLREKEAEAEIAKASPTSYLRIIAPGLVPPEPATPRRAFVLVLAGLLGLLAGAALVYGVALARATPGDVPGLQRETLLPLAASLPHLGHRPDALAAGFRQLATRLALKGLLAPGTTLVLSAFTDNEGLDFVAGHLRRALLAQGRRVRTITVPDAPAQPYPDAAAPGLVPHPDELLLVRNLPLAADSHALAVMAQATHNLVVLDAPTTPTARLAELESLVADYDLPAVQLCLNRAGYAPGPLRGLLRWLRRSEPVRGERVSGKLVESA